MGMKRWKKNISNEAKFITRGIPPICAVIIVIFLFQFFIFFSAQLLCNLKVSNLINHVTKQKERHSKTDSRKKTQKTFLYCTNTMSTFGHKLFLMSLFFSLNYRPTKLFLVIQPLEKWVPELIKLGHYKLNIVEHSLALFILCMNILNGVRLLRETSFL